MPLADCAEELEIGKELLRDYAMRGCPHDKGGRGKPNLFDPDEVTAWMKANGLTGLPGRPAMTDSPDIEAAKLREINLRCRKHEIHIAEREGQLIPTQDAKQWIGEHIAAAKGKFIGMGAALAPQLEGRDAAERQDIIDRRIREILDELSEESHRVGVR
ncbi:MAG TPA: hypothetical protein VGE74_21100 [Gemmata sp.]